MNAPVVRRVLVAVDLSESARVVLSWAETIAEKHGAHLEVLHVWEHPGNDEVAREVEAAARRELAAVVGSRAVTFEAGDASEVVVRRSADVDLVVVGTHGRRGAAHFLLGSVAERIVRDARCAVLVVRAA